MPELNEQQGPWTQYGAPPPAALGNDEEGPWVKYAKPEESPELKQNKQHVEAEVQKGKQTFASRHPWLTDLATNVTTLGGLIPQSTHAEDYSLYPGVKQMVTHPIQSAEDIVKPMVGAQSERWKKARAATDMAALHAEASSPLKAMLEGLNAGAYAAEGSVPFVGPWLGEKAEGIERGIQQRDPREVVNQAEQVGIGGALGGLGKKPSAAKAATDRAYAATQASKGLETALATPAGKAGERAAAMKEDIRVATGDLSEIEKEAPAKVSNLLKRGKGSENFHDLAEKIDARQDEMWEKGHNAGIDRHPDAPAKMKDVAAAGYKLLTDEAKTAAPQEAAAAEAWLKGIEKDRNVKSLDGLIREINDDLKGKDALNRYGPLQVRVRQGVVKAARNEVERILTGEGEKGVKAVNRRWGALENIKGRLRERAIQEAQREAKGGPVPDWVHLYTFMHPEGAALGMSIAAGKMLRPSGNLTRSTMRNFGKADMQAPFEATPPPGWGAPPRGLLPAPAPQISIPLEPSVPGRGAVEAPRQTYRDPATGRMARGYKGEMPPAVVGWTAEGGPIYENTPAPQARPIEQQAAEISRNAPTREERRATPRLSDISGPDFMRTTRTNQLRAALKDPSLTHQERVILLEQLNDMLEHPFERAEGEQDINRIKAAKEKRKTRAEAEKSVEERKKGRRQRFGD